MGQCCRSSSANSAFKRTAQRNAWRRAGRRTIRCSFVVRPSRCAGHILWRPWQSSGGHHRPPGYCALTHRPSHARPSTSEPRLTENQELRASMLDVSLSKHNIAYRTPCQGEFWGFPQVFWGLCWRGRKAGGVRRGQTRCRVWRAFPWVMPCCGCWCGRCVGAEALVLVALEGLEGLEGLVVGRNSWREGSEETRTWGPSAAGSGGVVVYQDGQEHQARNSARGNRQLAAIGQTMPCRRGPGEDGWQDLKAGSYFPSGGGVAGGRAVSGRLWRRGRRRRLR